MLILFDQATPVPLRSFLKGHTVRTAAQQGWDRLRNGDPLNAAEAAGFQMLLTTDKNMRYQQNLAGRKLTVLVLGQQDWGLLRPQIQIVVDAVNQVAPGSYTEVEIPSR
jgi:predicted nuclease of predicted toxin-antitoxin system